MGFIKLITSFTLILAVASSILGRDLSNDSLSDVNLESMKDFNLVVLEILLIYSFNTSF
jgi:hypothetical protein